MKSIIRRLINRLARSIAKEVAAELTKSNRVLRDQVYQAAIGESVQFVLQHGAKALVHASKQDLWTHACKEVPADGLILEFGVWKGESINFLAKELSDRTLYGFDSFEGLAENWTGSNKPKGFFSLDGVLPPVESNVELRKGWIEDTLDVFLAEQPGKVAMLHIDTDTYSPASYVLNACADRFVDGTLVMFDELLSVPNWQNHEYKALKETLPDDSYEFIGFAQSQALIRITNVEAVTKHAAARSVPSAVNPS